MIMSTTTRYSSAVDFLSDTGTPKLGRIFSSIRRTLQGIGEGFATSRRYHELTARGMTHEQAASKVFLDHFGTR